MTATKVGVVIGAVSRIIRRVVIADDDSYYKVMVLIPGEHLVLLDAATKTDNQTLTGAIAVATGVSPPNTSERCVAVDAQGIVTQVISADPLIDKLSGSTIIQNDTANVDDKVVVPGAAAI